MPDYTILVIDYDPRSVTTTAEPLRQAGYGVEVAVDGISGLEVFQRSKPNLVLIEAMIPKKHGFDVCQEIKRSAEGKRTPVVITTAVYKGRKYRSQAKHIYGCDDYLEKPFTTEQLLEVCANLLQGQAPAEVQEPQEDKKVVNASQPAAATTPEPPMPAPAPPPLKAVGPFDGVTAPDDDVHHDGAEDEIMARLDAILPGFGTRPDPAADEPPSETVAADEPPVQDSSEAAETRSEPEAETQGQDVAEPPAGPAESPVDATPPDPSAEADPVDALFAQTRSEAETEAASASVPDEAPADQAPEARPAGREKKRRKKKKARVKQAATTPEVSEPPSDGGAEPEPPQAVPVEDPPVPPSELPDSGRPGGADVFAATPLPTEAAVVPEAIGDPWPATQETFTGSTSSSKLWIGLAALIVVGLAIGAFFFWRGSGSETPPAEETSFQTSVSRRADASLRPVTPPYDASSFGAAEKALAAADDTTDSAVTTPAESPDASEVASEPTAPPVQVKQPAARATAPPKRSPPTRSAPKAADRRPAPAPARSNTFEGRETTTAGARAAPPGLPSRKTSPEPTPTPTTPTPDRVPPPPTPAPAIEPEPRTEEAAASEPPAPVATLEPATTTAPVVEKPAEAEPPEPEAVTRPPIPGQLVKLKDVDVAPKAISRKPPVYTSLAKRLRHQGDILVRVLINEKGRVDTVEVLSGIPNSDLNNAAVRAVQRWRYEPARKAGVPVKVWKVEKLSFRL